MFKFIILAASAALASAYTTPTTQCTDSCNPISKPGLDEVVPAGSPYTVTWQPTTSGTVTIVLMKGPSTDILPLYAIAENVANTGTYSWTPSTDLEPTGDTGYGFQLIDDADGTYQWSTQFGISNPAYSSSASGSASAGASATAGGSSSTTTSLAGNGTVSSAAASHSAAPTGYSNSTVIASSPSSGATATTLTVNTVASSATASASHSSSSQSNGAVTIFGTSSIVSVFAAIAAFVAL